MRSLQALETSAVKRKVREEEKDPKGLTQLGA